MDACNKGTRLTFKLKMISEQTYIGEGNISQLTKTACNTHNYERKLVSKTYAT